MSRLSAIAVWTALGGLAASPSASAFSLLGAEVLPVRDSAVDVQLGYPEVRLGYHLPVLKNLEINPRFSFFYSDGWDAAGDTLSVGNFGVRVGADFKLQLIGEERWHLGLIWKFGVPLNCTPEFTGGLQLGLLGGLVADYEATDAVRIIGGLHLQTAVLFVGDGVYNLPVVFELSTEFAVTSKIQVALTFEGGPSFFFSRGQDPFTRGYVAGFLGLQFLL